MKILKVKDWLKFGKPDYEGFLTHVRAWDKDGISYGFSDLLRIALAYNIDTSRLKSNGTVILSPL